MTNYDLQRFLKAQESDYATALTEVISGRKKSHWMWYVFPQIRGLGFSETSRYYGIINKAEAIAYLQHPVLGNRLIEICTALLQLPLNNAGAIFGYPDNLKLKSSMTLFAALPAANTVFQAVLDKYFDGATDEQTLKLLRG